MAAITLPNIAQIETQIRTLQPQWQGPISEVRYLSGGYANANYFFRYGECGYVVRIAAGGSGPQQSNLAFMSYAQQAQRLADIAIAGGPNTCDLMAFDVHTGNMISGYINQPLLAHSAQRPGLLTELAAYLNDLHRSLAYCVPVSAGHYDPIALARRWLVEPPHWLDSWLRDLVYTPWRWQCCHNDLNPWNVLTSAAGANAWLTLDWETCAHFDPLFDAVTLYEGWLGCVDASALHPSEQLSLAEFCAACFGCPVPAAQLQQCVRLFWLREYAWALAARAGGNPNPDIAQQIDDAGERLRGLLAQNLG